MAYTEFYITRGSGASNENGGSAGGLNDAPLVSYDTGVSTDAPGTTITHASGWSGASVGDWVSVNDANGTATNWAISRITVISGTDLTVSPALPAAFRGEANAKARVGGAWATLEGGKALIEVIGASAWPAGVSPPCINIRIPAGVESAYAALSAQVAWNLAWTATIPLTVEAYSNAPHDIDWVGSTTRLTLTASLVTSLFDFVSNSGNVRFLNLYINNTNAGANAHGISFAATPLSTNAVKFYNCRFGSTGAKGVHTTDTSNNGYIEFWKCQASGCASHGFHVPRASKLYSCLAFSNGGAGIYAANGGSIQGCTSYSNGSYGLRMDVAAGSSTLVGGIIGNTSALNVDSGLYLDDAGTAPQNAGMNNIFGNILAFNGVAGTVYGIEGADATGYPAWMYSSNCIYGNFTAGVLQGPTDLGGNVLLDPQFVNSGSADFRLRSTSPALFRDSNNRIVGWMGSGGMLSKRRNPTVENSVLPKVV